MYNKGLAILKKGEKSMNDKWIIQECRNKLHGTIKPSGNKNEALPAICAALLSEEEVVLENVPDITDVRDMLTIIRSIGAQVSFENNSVRIIPRDAYDLSDMDADAARRIRASFLLAGVLLTKHRSVFLPSPGGDSIGSRPLNVHFDLFAKLGIITEEKSDGYLMEWKKQSGIDHLFLDEPSVMATENILMLCSRIEKTIIIENTAAEPHIQGLCRMLCDMGCMIEGIGSNRLIITGCSKLVGIRHRVSCDHIEIGSFISLAIAQKCSLRIMYDKYENIRPILNVYKWLGAGLDIKEGIIELKEREEYAITPPKGVDILKVADGPWPNFPSDLMSTVIVAATQCRGSMLFFEKMFESRLYFVDELIRMGARIVHCDPHRVITMGPSPLRGILMSSPDIRAGYALLIAALCAKGTTTLSNIKTVNRGYEDVLGKLKSIGACIESR